MRKFLFIISFIVMLGQVVVGLAEETPIPKTRATAEEEVVADSVYRETRKAFDPADMSDEVIQAYLQFRDAHPNTKTAVRATNAAGNKYARQGNYEAALECYQWEVAFYELLYAEELSVIHDSTASYRQREQFWGYFGYPSALEGMANMYFYLENYAKAKKFYAQLRDKKINYCGGKCWIDILEEDWRIIENSPDAKRLKRKHAPLRIAAPISSKPGYYRLRAKNTDNLAKLMIYLIENKYEK